MKRFLVFSVVLGLFVFAASLISEDQRRFASCKVNANADLCALKIYGR